MRLDQKSIFSRLPMAGSLTLLKSGHLSMTQFLHSKRSLAFSGLNSFFFVPSQGSASPSWCKTSGTSSYPLRKPQLWAQSCKPMLSSYPEQSILLCPYALLSFISSHPRVLSMLLSRNFLTAPSPGCFLSCKIFFIPDHPKLRKKFDLYSPSPQ